MAFSLDAVEHIACGNNVAEQENNVENGGLGLIAGGRDGAAAASASQPLMMSEASQPLPVLSK